MNKMIYNVLYENVESLTRQFLKSLKSYVIPLALRWYTVNQFNFKFCVLKFLIIRH